MEAALEAVLAQVVDGFESLLACRQLSAGASQETYRVILSTKRGEQHLALRRGQSASAADSTVGGISLSAEAGLFRLAGAAGIPGPRVVHVLEPGDGLGKGFIMEWLEGETLGQRIVRSESLAAIRPALARQCGQILGRIHALDWQAGGLDNELPDVMPEALVDETWEFYRDLDVPVPMIDYSWRWLKDNLPDQSRRTLVHGDFRNGNLMVTPQGINAVLDWELAHIGDPVRDLGWLCVNSWRFGCIDLPVGGFGSIEQLLEGYQAESGIAITTEELRFWQIFGSFWWSVTTLGMAATWRSGETPSLERPVIGRRSSEAQMDCVNLLIPGDFELPEAITLDEGTQLPMPAELLEGVRSFLREDLAAGDQQRFGFLAKVAANSLGIAQREFLYGPALARAEHERLSAMLGQGSLDRLRWQLVEELRKDLPLDTPGLGAHLRQSVAGQLSIDQPHYSALRATP